MARQQDVFHEDYDDAYTAEEWCNKYSSDSAIAYLYIRVSKTVEEEHESYDSETESYYTWYKKEIFHWSYFFNSTYRYIPSDGFNVTISRNDGFGGSLTARRCVSTAWNGTPARNIDNDEYCAARDDEIISKTKPFITATYQGNTISGPNDSYEENPSSGILWRETTYNLEGSSSGGYIFDNKGIGWHCDENLELVHSQLPDAYVMEDNPTSWELDENGILVTPLLPETYVNRQGAFSGCDTLEEVVIPATCTSIGMWSFYGTSLTEVELPEECTYYATSFPPGCRITGGILIDEFGNPVNNEI